MLNLVQTSPDWYSSPGYLGQERSSSYLVMNAHTLCHIICNEVPLHLPPTSCNPGPHPYLSSVLTSVQLPPKDNSRRSVNRSTNTAVCSCGLGLCSGQTPCDVATAPEACPATCSSAAGAGARGYQCLRHSHFGRKRRAAERSWEGSATSPGPCAATTAHLYICLLRQNS